MVFSYGDVILSKENTNKMAVSTMDISSQRKTSPPSEISLAVSKRVDTIISSTKSCYPLRESGLRRILFIAHPCLKIYTEFAV